MIAVVCHDAGGAELVSSYLRRNPQPCVYALEGPARRVFERKIAPLSPVPLPDAIGMADSILCSTSWQSTLEIEAIRMARAQGKRSIAFLDHWVNYEERFSRGGETVLPDEIWVADEFARAMAAGAFPGTPVTIIDNPYFLDVREELDRMQGTVPAPRSCARVLYVTEPTRETCLRLFGNERSWGYTEEEALRYFLDNVDALSVPVAAVAIRPHPSEQAAKYQWAAREFADVVVVDAGSRPLLQDIAEADVVAGCDTMALVIGLLARKRVVSCVPPGGKPISLPQTAIEKLSDLCVDMRQRQT